jgi:hypothetical protein
MSIGLLLLICAVFSVLTANPVLAGGGPENVLLVVNRNSIDSMTIANHYAKLRKIPPGNILTLSWDGDEHRTTVADFREKILLPVLKTISQRKLGNQIDYVIYSSGFPWGITLDSDVTRIMEAMKNVQPDYKWPKQKTKVGSLNGMTFLGQGTLHGLPWYFDPHSNFYARGRTTQEEPTLAFKAAQQYGPRGERVKTGGRQYFLSTMLGVTAGRGNTVDEVLHYLDRSAMADGTKPRGTIYYMQNKDVRTTARTQGLPFTVAVKALKAMGVEAEILLGKLPHKKDDVQGLMTGTASFNWKASGSTIRPGAICEHFTSYGGMMNKEAGQTPLAIFLLNGAAAASGTVTEPYALAYKFPDPMMHVHYARGCSLAESFYQSLASPYQLLIVGDPLCRPWASIPRVTVKGVKHLAVVKGKLSLRPAATSGGKLPVDRFDLLIDGLRRASCGLGGSLDFDTAILGDGYHELRVVAIEDGLIRSQGRWISSITTNNHGRTITAEANPATVVRADEPLTITVNSPGSSSIALLHNSRLLGSVKGSAGKLLIKEPIKLGYGTIELRAVGLSPKGPSTYAWAKPIVLTVKK